MEYYTAENLEPRRVEELVCKIYSSASNSQPDCRVGESEDEGHTVLRASWNIESFSYSGHRVLPAWWSIESFRYSGHRVLPAWWSSPSDVEDKSPWGMVEHSPSGMVGIESFRYGGHGGPSDMEDIESFRYGGHRVLQVWWT